MIGLTHNLKKIDIKLISIVPYTIKIKTLLKRFLSLKLVLNELDHVIAAEHMGNEFWPPFV